MWRIKYWYLRISALILYSLAAICDILQKPLKRYAEKKIQPMNSVCLGFFWGGLIVAIASLLNNVFGIIDRNITWVLLPMSFAYMLMILLIDNLWFSGE